MKSMSTAPDQFVETALSLPQAVRADLAFQLLQSLDLPGDEITDEAFGAELRQRVEAYRRGAVESVGLDDARVIVQTRLADGRSK